MLDDGLLEQPVLLLRPLGGRGWAFLSCTGNPVGFAREVASGSGWWPFRRSFLSIHEQDDEPLVFTVERCWGLRWWLRVLDANEMPVGLVVGRRLLTRFGTRLGSRQDKGFVTPRGRVLAELVREEGGMRLCFAEEVRPDPFAKMLLLAAAVGG